MASEAIGRGFESLRARHALVINSGRMHSCRVLPNGKTLQDFAKTFATQIGLGWLADTGLLKESPVVFFAPLTGIVRTMGKYLGVAYRRASPLAQKPPLSQKNPMHKASGFWLIIWRVMGF